MTSDALEQQILAFVRDPGTGEFGELALALFERQFERIPGYHEHCRTLSVTPLSVADWREIPALEASESASLKLQEPAGLLPGILAAALPDVHAEGCARLVLDIGCDAAAGALTGALATAGPGDGFFSRNGRIDAKRLRSWLGARQRDSRPVQIVASGPGYAGLVEVLARRGLRFRLPPGSTAFHLVSTGAPASVWNPALSERLGLAAESCRRIFYPAPSSTPLVEEPQGAGDGFLLPHWVRPSSAEPGRVALLDLASIGRPAHRFEADSTRLDGERPRLRVVFG